MLVYVFFRFIFAFRVLCHLVPELFAYVVLGLVYSVLSQETGLQERIQFIVLSPYSLQWAAPSPSKLSLCPGDLDPI